MRLTRHHTPAGPRWAADGEDLLPAFSLSLLCQAESPRSLIDQCRANARTIADLPLLAPIDDHQELWAAGVTYLRSKTARAEESDVGARLYEHVYESDRPELFWKATGRRTVGNNGTIRVRRDSGWDVPEPELVVLVSARLQIIGYTAGNDVSSRSIEGENPLFLPQAKVYDGSAAIGTGIRLADAETVRSLPISLAIARGGSNVFQGDTTTAEMKRTPAELARWLGAELTFPDGALLMTGTCLVPDSNFTLTPGDEVSITVGEESLTNPVA